MPSSALCRSRVQRKWLQSQRKKSVKRKTQKTAPNSAASMRDKVVRSYQNIANVVLEQYEMKIDNDTIVPINTN